MNLLYEEKHQGYYSLVRSEVLSLLPKNSNRILEVGCGAGDTLAYLKSNGMCEWAGGVEIFPDAAEQARKKGIDMVEEGDIEALALPIAPGSLDVILCLDVLEHLVDPWITVRKLHTFLKPGGVMIASLPNVRNLKVIVPLIMFGDWKYTKEGLLDKTHLRFFTRKTAVELMECSGLKVDKVPTFFQRGSKAAIANTLTLSLFKNFLQFQYLVRAVN